MMASCKRSPPGDQGVGMEGYTSFLLRRVPVENVETGATCLQMKTPPLGQPKLVSTSANSTMLYYCYHGITAVLPLHPASVCDFVCRAAGRI